MSGVTISCQTTKTTKNMKAIEFIPQKFHDVKLGYYETSKNECSPGYPLNASDFLWSEIAINVPDRIICNVLDSTFAPIIPICGAYIISQKRGLKYAHLSDKVLHIKIDNTWHSSVIVDPDLQYEHPALPPNYEEEEIKRQQRIKEVQKYSDEEIDKKGGQGFGGFFNVNLLDYIKFPLESGVYEIFMSTCGLESNRVKVEIVFNE